MELISAAEHPVIPGFFPDPTICRVGDDFYLACSSFEYFPGVPIFHSTDLIEWVQLGNIMTRRSQFRRGDGAASSGLYAGTLRHHDGRFWYITSNVSDYSAGQLIVTAVDPAGEWSDPVFVPDAVGIDPDLFWDRDGTCYLTWNALDFEAGKQGIRQAVVDPSTGALRSPPVELWEGSGLPGTEGPHLYSIDGSYYLMVAEGGTERGHCVSVARSDSVTGPFLSCPANPIFTHRSTFLPVQNVGHADLVVAPDGAWAAVHLGVRPRGSTPGFHVLGRETFLSGVGWVDGWPTFEPDRYVLPTPATAFRDEFLGDSLDPRWVVPAGDPRDIAQLEPDGGVRLRAGDHGELLCARVRDLSWRAVAQFDGDGRFGIRIDDRHLVELRVLENEATVRVRIGEVDTIVASLRVREAAALRIDCRPSSSPPVPLGRGGPDELVLSVRQDDEWIELWRGDGRYFSTEVASGFTGRMLALGSTGPDAVLRSLVYRPRGNHLEGGEA